MPAIGDKEYIERLKQTVEAAKQKLEEQNEVLKRLTSPPLIVATVIRLNVRNLQQVSAAEVRQRDLNKKMFVTLKGQKFITTGETEKFGLKIGDEVELLPTQAKIRDQIANAKKLEIVGFSGHNDVVMRIDGGTVSVDPFQIWEKYFRVKPVQNAGPVSVIKAVAKSIIAPLSKLASLKKVVLTQDTVTLAFEEKLMDVEVPSFTVAPGDQVLIHPATFQIISLTNPVLSGETTFVKTVIDKDHVEIEHMGSTRIIPAGNFVGKIEEGDRVLLDKSFSIVLANLGKEDSRFNFNKTTNITWTDIGGLDDAKKLMIEAIELPLKFPALYASYGKKQIKGVLLHGPPGCGKTLIAKATATTIAQLHAGKGAETAFIYVKGPEILDRYVGVAEGVVRQIFQQARKHKADHGYPAVIFIDEADAIFGKRGSGVSSDMEKTIVPMFLTEMDGLEESDAFVLLGTNRADILDPAVVRDGRIDRKIKIDRPDRKSTVEIFKIHLKGVPFNNGFTIDDIAALGTEQLFDDKYHLYDVKIKKSAAKNLGLGKVIKFTLANLRNGAMIAGIVDQATSAAVDRDIKSGGAASGITKDDIVYAVECVFKQNQGLNHKDEIIEFIDGFRADVESVSKPNNADNLLPQSEADEAVMN